LWYCLKHQGFSDITYLSLPCSKANKDGKQLGDTANMMLAIATVFQHLKDIETASDATQLQPLDAAQHALDGLSSSFIDHVSISTI